MHQLQSAFDFYLEKYKAQLADMAATKKVLMELAREMGVEVELPSDEGGEIQAGGSIPIKIDEFVNKAPSTALQEYLGKRGKENGAVTWEAIVSVLKQGGFDFGKFGGEKAVRMTLIKNTTAFKFIRKQNAFGLKAWYGTDQKAKKKDGKRGENSPDEHPTDETKSD